MYSLVVYWQVLACVPRVVDAFIAGRLASVEAAAEGRIEDPLDDVDMLQTQLEVRA